MTLSIKSARSGATERLAETIGRSLKGGETIELVGDLGSGKTTFTKGLVRGANSKSAATSPSFVLSKVYKTPKFSIRHFDFYRLSEPGVVAQELAESVQDKNEVVVIEWGESVQNVLPKNRLIVSFAHASDNERKIQITCPKKLSYLLNGVKNADPND